MRRFFITLILIGSILSGLPKTLSAIPIFARLHKTSCVTCHDVFPHLNAFGEAFKNRGYRYPKDFEKKSHRANSVAMGAEAYKKMWPKAIWPTDIPRMFPVAAHFSARYAQKQAPEGNSTFTIPAKTDFLFAANFDENFSLFAEIEMNTIHDIEFGYRFQYRFSPALNIALGTVGPAYWLRDHYRLPESPYYWAQWQNRSATWQFNDGTSGGIELWGNREYATGGLSYAAGIGNGQSNANNIDVNNHKDFYFYAAYKFGGVGLLGRMKINRAHTGEPFDNHLKISVFYYNGQAGKTYTKDTFFLYGASISGRWNSIRLATGIHLMRSHFFDETLNRTAMYFSGRYRLYPWLWGLLRYERQRTVVKNTQTEQRIIPAIVALIRANVRFSAEYLKNLNAAPDTGLRLNLNFAF